MNKLLVDIKNTEPFLTKQDIENRLPALKDAYRLLNNKSGPGNDFLGWINLPSETGKDIFEQIYTDVGALSQEVEVFVVVGIGGSYLGTRAIIDALSNHFSHYKSASENQRPHILYAGHNLCQDYLAELLNFLDKKEYALTVISKSGTTTEPAVAFRLLKEHLVKKYGLAKAKERIIAITDKEKGALKTLADKESYKTYVIPDDIGGRYSVLTPVGLLPVAMAGLDISALINGAQFISEHIFNTNDVYENPASLYAIARNILYEKGKNIEILASYHPSMYYFIEWWKQLFGESEGKEHKGIFPAGVTFTTDLHSLGQYIQEGQRHLFETCLHIEKPSHPLHLPYNDMDTDGLNYLSGKEIDFINKMAEAGTTAAHVDGGVPNIKISIKKRDEFNMGQLIFFFEMSCALSGYMLGVNPFDQPGVEAYKKNMFELLGKPK